MIIDPAFWEIDSNCGLGYIENWFNPILIPWIRGHKIEILKEQKLDHHLRVKFHVELSNGNDFETQKRWLESKMAQ